MAHAKTNKELQIIRAAQAAFRRRVPGLVVGIGDDAAAVSSGAKDRYLLYTADMLVESVHFKKGEDARKVGHKALAVSVSDIAAMGGEPRYALVCVGLPKKGALDIAKDLMAGIKRCADRYDVAVIGGDAVQSSRLVVDVFMTGEVKRDHLVVRSGARDGDQIFVSGPLGGSGRGRHLTFAPRLEASRFLVSRFKVTSMIDLSDGLAMDLNRVAAASKVGAMIFEDKIPRNPGVRDAQQALCEGEDFELLFTLSPGDAVKLVRACKQGQAPCRFYPIGKMTRLVKGVKMVASNGRVTGIAAEGFKHFIS